MTDIYRPAGAAFASVCSGPGTGLVGTINVRIEDTSNNIVTAATTAGIIESGTAIYTAALIAPALEGDYLVIWNDGTTDGADIDRLEVTTGAFDPTDVCTIEDLDAVMRSGSDSVEDDVKLAAIGVAVTAFEKEANRAFSIRQVTETVRADYGDLILSCSDLRSVDAIADWTGDVAGLDFQDDEIYGTWTRGAKYTVTYTHGIDPPADVRRAVALIASSIVLDGPWDDRGFAIDDGTGLVRLLTAGVSGASFSIPEVQAALVRHREPWVGRA